MHTYDVAIIGAGILGLATALQLQALSPRLKVAVIEKEPTVARHQTGHNSGVIHSGIYYKPGSAKAANCRTGIELLRQFCDTHTIPYTTCGKVIVATHASELARLHALAQRGQANGVPGLEIIGPERLRELEPAAAGIQALYSPHTAIVDFARVARAYTRLAVAQGADLFLGEQLHAINTFPQALILQTSTKELTARHVINCAGAQADKVAHLAGYAGAAGRIIPFRGEYYRLVPEKNDLVRGLIYPVPDPKFPFLGVHLSRTIHGIVEAGPNAVLALSREGYRYADIDARDCKDFLSYRGFWRMAAAHWQVGLYELYRSCSKRAFLASLQRLIPQLTAADIVPNGSGVRSQLVAPNGAMVDDFSIVADRRMIHVLNAPSPAATASLAIGRHIAAMAQRQFGY